MSLTDFNGYGEVNSISFSNKGTQFAASWSNMQDCKVYNLRKI